MGIMQDDEGEDWNPCPQCKGEKDTPWYLIVCNKCNKENELKYG